MLYEKYKNQLEAELSMLVSELKTIAVKNPETNDWIAIPATEEIGNSDENVEADVIEEWNERRAVLQQLETRYRNIVRALEKIESGTYGICEISGEPIEEERLKINPAARTNLANIDRERELTI